MPRRQPPIRQTSPPRIRTLLWAGMTLVEIMVVLAILAIAGTLAVPVYQNYINEARIATAIKDIRQISLILDDLFLDGNPPATLAAVGINQTDPWGNQR